MRFTLPRYRSTIGSVGIAFDTDEVRLLQLRDAAGGLRITGAARCSLPAAGGGERSLQQLAESLRSAVVSGGFAGRRCVISLPREDVFLQSLKLPVMPDEELVEAVAWEASQRMNVSRDSIRSDWIRTGATSEDEHGRDEVLVIAAHRDALDRRLEAACEAGLRPMAVDTHFGAVARLFSRQHRRAVDIDSCRAVLEVGIDGATVIILRGDQVVFCKALDIGGHRFNHRVAEKLCLDVDSAAELRQARLRRDPGSKFIDPSTEQAVHEAVRPLLGELARNVLMCLRYVAVTFRGIAPEMIVVTGADGCEPGLASEISTTCQVPVQTDDEHGTLKGLEQGIHSIMQRDPGPVEAWVVAAGLSLRGLTSSTRQASSSIDQSRSAAA